MPGIFKLIPSEDQTITPFKVYKSWEYTGTASTRYSGLISESISVSTAIKPNPNNFSNGKIPLDFDEEVNKDPSAYLLNFTNKNIPAGVLWLGLKHSYFNDYNGQINFAGNASPNIKIATNLNIWSGESFKRNSDSLIKTYDYIENKLNPSSSCELGSIASVISIPQSKFGEEIKPGSLEIELTNTTFNNSILTDDGNGNLISNDLLPIPKINNRLIYLGFNESEYNKISSTVKEDPRYPAELSFYNVIPTRSFIEDTNQPLGIAAHFSHSYIRVDGTPSYFNPRTNDDYAISFWFKLDTITPGHGNSSHLISKRGLFRNYGLVNPSGRRTAGNIWRPNTNITPYDIFVTQAGALRAQIGDGTTLITLSTANGAITNNSYYHVVLQKNGSTYELYLNGSPEDTETKTLVNITNKADIFIGCKGLDIRNNNEPASPIIGKIDEIQIFNTYLTAGEITQLSTESTLNNSYNVGKIFYREGLIVITGLHPSLGSILNVSTATNLLFSPALYNNSTNSYISTSTGQISSITIRWNSTLTLYENEFLCRINEEEYNFTMNPSILKDTENGQLPKEFIYNEEFGPYITTIGLYNENAELLAIGKLAGPIKKRSNVDLNIIVRFDQ